MSVHHRTDHWGLVAGLIAGHKQTMRRFDESCLTVIHGFTAKEIRALRERELQLWKEAKSPAAHAATPLCKGGLGEISDRVRPQLIQETSIAIQHSHRTAATARGKSDERQMGETCRQGRGSSWKAAWIRRWTEPDRAGCWRVRWRRNL